MNFKKLTLISSLLISTQSFADNSLQYSVYQFQITQGTHTICQGELDTMEVKHDCKLKDSNTYLTLYRDTDLDKKGDVLYDK